MLLLAKVDKKDFLQAALNRDNVAFLILNSDPVTLLLKILRDSQAGRLP